MENVLNLLYQRMGVVADLKHSATLLEWDQHTFMPPKSVTARARQMATLQKLAHDYFIHPETGKLLQQLERMLPQLSETDQDFVTVTREDYEKQLKMPSELVEELAKATSEGMAVWIEARKTGSFKHFLPNLTNIVSLSLKLADCLGYDKEPYDALLDQYEPGITTDDLLPILSELGNKLPSLLIEFKALSRNDNLLTGPWYPADQQKKLYDKLIDEMGFNFEFGRMDESVHPFTMAFSCHDVRLTTRYHESIFSEAFFGSIHEAGHGIYEQSIPCQFTRTPLGEAASLGFHESQSRFYENIIARDKTFWEVNFERWKKAFPKSPAMDFMDVYKYVNTVKPSLIRVEADEISYNLHIIIRFELERQILSEKLKLKDLPEAWNAAYQKYLGIMPDNDVNGVLQDIHWSAGLFGYFPTYTIGNLISVQLKELLEKEVSPLNILIREGEYSLIKEWLQKKVYDWGKRKKPKNLLEQISGKGLETESFIRYISEKYQELIKIK